MYIRPTHRYSWPKPAHPWTIEKGQPIQHLHHRSDLWSRQPIVENNCNLSLRSYSPSQCGSWLTRHTLWISRLCNVHSEGKDNIWLKRQSSYLVQFLRHLKGFHIIQFLRHLQGFQTKFNPYVSPYKWVHIHICGRNVCWFHFQYQIDHLSWVNFSSMT